MSPSFAGVGLGVRAGTGEGAGEGVDVGNGLGVVMGVDMGVSVGAEVGVGVDVGVGDGAGDGVGVGSSVAVGKPKPGVGVALSKKSEAWFVSSPAGRRSSEWPTGTSWQGGDIMVLSSP